MTHLNNRSIKGNLNRDKCVNSEVVGTTHPFADFCFTLTQLESKILLLQTFLFQDIMYTVNNTKRQCY